MTDEAEDQATTDALNAGAEQEERAIQADETAHFGGDPEAFDGLQATGEGGPVHVVGFDEGAEMPNEPVVDIAPNEPEASAEPAAVVGSIGSNEPSTEPEVAAVLPAFPHDLDGSHALDSLSIGDLVRKTTETGYSRQAEAHFSDGNLIATGDALAHLPIGSTIEKNAGGQVVMTLPETDTRGPFLTFGKNVHRCIAQAWPWLVGEGHARVSA